jgi:hypothetical protein
LVGAITRPTSQTNVRLNQGGQGVLQQFATGWRGAIRKKEIVGILFDRVNYQYLLFLNANINYNCSDTQ